jgi:hypothetical protein
MPFIWRFAVLLLFTVLLAIGGMLRSQLSANTRQKNLDKEYAQLVAEVPPPRLLKTIECEPGLFFKLYSVGIAQKGSVGRFDASDFPAAIAFHPKITMEYHGTTYFSATDGFSISPIGHSIYFSTTTSDALRQLVGAIRTDDREREALNTCLRQHEDDFARFIAFQVNNTSVDMRFLR